VLDLAAGESLSDHEVHERTWLLVIDGAIELTTAAGERASGEAGLLIELAPGERHEVIVSLGCAAALLTPWPRFVTKLSVGGGVKRD
jgi:hypothetical protein